MPRLLFSILILFLLGKQAAAKQAVSSPEQKGRVEVVLVGSTSSLARKYLFQSLFKAYLEEESKEQPPSNITFTFYGAATRPMEEGLRLLEDYLQSSTTCKGVTGLEASACETKLQQYREMVQYVQLRGESQYKELGRKLQAAEKREEGPLIGRLFYLSISPDLYASVAKFVSTYARPTTAGAWLRVVFEKPFGRDLASAKALAQDLSTYLDENEIYRVDHYMGKTAVQAILRFRHANKHRLEDIWSGKHVTRMEVVMKETEDCEGRTSYYENYGTIRDVLQNHLTQVLCILKMDLPTDEPDNVFGPHGHRINVLKNLESAASRATVHVGQYEGYHDHVANDRKTPSHFIKTTVPTAASVTLSSANPRWEGVDFVSKAGKPWTPGLATRGWEGVDFVLKAGKALDSRTSYARVTLRGAEEEEECQLVFNIQGGDLGTAIAWNRRACATLLANLTEPEGWKESETRDLHVLSPVDENLPNAYEVVVKEVLEGDRSMFLGTEELLHQWIVWDKVLEQADKMEPHIYPLGFDIDCLEAIRVLEGEDHDEL